MLALLISSSSGAGTGKERVYLCVFVSLWSPPLLAWGIFECRNLFLLELGRDADEQGREGEREGGSGIVRVCSCAYVFVWSMSCWFWCSGRTGRSGPLGKGRWGGRERGQASILCV